MNKLSTAGSLPPTHPIVPYADVAAVATFGRKPGAVVAGVSAMVAALLIGASPPPRGAWGLP